MLELLLMDPEINSRIAEVILYAESNPFDFETMKYASENRLPIIPQDCDNYEIELPMGIRVVYTIEEHPKGLCKHISISQNNEIPSTDFLYTILNNFGFSIYFRETNSYVYYEKCSVNNKECNAINVIQNLY